MRWPSPPSWWSVRRGTTFSLGPSSRTLLVFPGPDLRDALRERHLELRLRSRRIVEVRKRDAGQRATDRLFDRTQIRLLFARHERERVARRFRAAGAPDPMNIVVGHDRYIEVHHVAE